MMDALWERKQAVDRVAAKQLNVTITALANFGVNNETVACETLTVVRKNTPLDATPSIHLSTSIDFATISRLVQHSHKWRSWYDHALTFPVPERYNANSLSRRQVELNRQAIETTDPYPLPSEETLCYAFSFLPLMYRRRLMWPVRKPRVSHRRAQDRFREVVRLAPGVCAGRGKRAQHVAADIPPPVADHRGRDHQRFGDVVRGPRAAAPGGELLHELRLRND